MERFLIYCQVKKNCDKPVEIVDCIFLKRWDYDSHNIKYTFIKGFYLTYYYWIRILGKCFNQFSGEIREPYIYTGWMNMEINL